MNTEEIKAMILEVSRTLVANEKLLCDLDSEIGDGDHGATVARGFREVERQLTEKGCSSKSFSSPAEVFEFTGHTLSVTMGGAIGPILGNFFQAGVKKLKDMQAIGRKEETVQEFTLQEFEVLFEEGLKKIQLLGGAAEGDRTLVDALAPASRALSDALTDGKSLKQAFEDAKKAAERGAENTKNMQAKKGRARFLMERSLGYVDAGATTMAIIIRAMCDFIKE